MVLKQSLLELMSDRPIGKITVKDICGRAEINRATFYAHYKDPFDLLGLIENELFETLKRSIDKGLQSGSIVPLLTDICTAIKENFELCKVIFSENGDKDFLEHVVNIAHDQSIAEWKKHASDATLDELERLYTFFSNGSAAIIRLWVKDDMKDHPRDIAVFIDKISNCGLKALSG